MTDFNKLMYGAAFGIFTSLLAAAILVLIVYGNKVPETINGTFISKIMLIQAVLGGLAFSLTRYKSTDGK